jgi:hypothetical protein
VWVEPLRPYLDAELDVLLSGWDRFAPALLLPGRSIRDGHANGRETFKSVESRRAVDRSVLLCYEAVEFEPTPPAPVLQFDDIRRIVTEDEAENGRRARGWFANAQQPIVVLPNAYYFARCTAEPGYARTPRDHVLADFAETLGGPKEALTIAWSCLERDLEHLPADVPARLRQKRLDGPAAADLPGGEAKYREILATAVECRRAVLGASRNGKDVEAVAAALESLGRWWGMNRYALSETAGDRLDLAWIHAGFTGPLHAACQANKAALAPHRQRLAAVLGKAAAIAPASADACVGQLLGP